MPPKKSKSPNAFWVFVQHFKDREASRGRQYYGMQELTNAAGEEWKKMNENDRKPYKMKAQDDKQKPVTKYTSLGEPIDQVSHGEQEAVKQFRDMETNIEQLIANKLAGNAFVNLWFYVAHVNYYCQVRSGRYYPAEISVIRFSLKDGVDPQDVFHVIINAGEVKGGEIFKELPIGYRLAVETNSAESHHIPIPPHDASINSVFDLRVVYSNLIEFLRTKLDKDEPLPPVYCEGNNSHVAKNVFQWMGYELGFEEEIEVSSLAYLFFCLRNAARQNVTDEQAFMSKAIAENELERDIYDFVKGISCPYHFVSDGFNHCSLSKVMRMVYMICDNCCKDVNIPLQLGRHVPNTAHLGMIYKHNQTNDTGLKADDSDSSSSVSDKMSELSFSPTKTKTTRLPITQSRVLDASAGLPPPLNPWGQPSTSKSTPQFSNNDFPSLGSRTEPRSALSQRGGASGRGRGRGRLLQQANQNASATGAIPKYSR